MELEEIKEIIQQRKGSRFQTEKDLSKIKREIKRGNKDIVNHEKAREIIRLVGKETQEQLTFHISDVTSLAMETVFENPYKLCMDFVQRRDKTECDITFERNGEKVNPLDSSGGGAADIASFALRIASYSMAVRKTRNTIILDEPFKFLSRDKIDKASQMLKELSNKLNIQFIIVSHDVTLIEYADRVFTNTIKKGVSSVKTTNNTKIY